MPIDPRVAGGLRDVPPAEMIPRERMLAAFRTTFASFGFAPIETPHIERMEVLAGKGAGSEEVLRQIYDVTNKGGKPGELALRFDLTVPFARFVAKHIHELGTPFKRYAIGSVFRGERPAKGRFREFTQCDFDTVGTESVVADAEIAQVIHAALEAAGVPPFTIALNNRKILDGFLATIGASDRTALILRSVDKRDKIGLDGMTRELTEPRADGSAPALNPDQAARLAAFVAPPEPGVDPLTRAEAEVGSDPGAARGIADLRTVLALLVAAGVPGDRLKVDLGLARGLDYYTGIVFETTVDGWERYGSISSGGRYDDLASLFTDRRLPGVGASIGLDRLLSLLAEAGKLPTNAGVVPVLVAQIPGVDPRVPVALAARLRRAGIGAEVYPDPIAVGKQMAYGTTRGHRLGVLVSPDQVQARTFTLRDLLTRQGRKDIPWLDLESTLAAALPAQPEVAPR